MTTGNDHCRIGSLENDLMSPTRFTSDHCRIGSLEIIGMKNEICLFDHCRIGSLEIRPSARPSMPWDHCRIGSLETWMEFIHEPAGRSLPHRQLRNAIISVGRPFPTITAA